jgi:F0F1-type ATP synthase gamma subunit
MKAIGNIKKITSAMKMVATAKMKADVVRLNRGKHFGVNVVPAIMENDPYLQRKLATEAPKRTCLIALTGDK